MILAPALWWAINGPGTLTVIGWTVTAVAFLNTTAQLIGISWMVNIRFKMILEAVRPAATSGVMMALAVWGTLLFLADALPIVQLVVSVAIGAVAYGSVI